MSVVSFVVSLYRRNPARSNAVIAAALVAAAARFHVVLPKLSVEHVLEIVGTVLASGEATHRRVTPVK